MRVTDSMKYASTTVAADSASSTVQQMQGEVSSGTDLNQPGDDPYASEQVLRYNNAIAGIDQTTKTINSSSAELQTADSAIDTVTNVMARARELAVEMANGTESASDRVAAATEVSQMGGELQNALNANVNGVYVFGGTTTDAPPFDGAGNYTGDTGVRSIETSPGTTQQVSIRADVAFKGVGGGQDIFAVLSSLQTALSTNNEAGITASLGQIDTSTTQVSLAQSQIGTYENALSTASTANSATKLTLQTDVSNVADSDIAGASVRLAQAQTALQATLSAAASTFKISLVNLLS